MIEALEALKPCPFCGGRDLDLMVAMRECYWSCNDCDADGPMCSEKEGATEKWNTRAALEQKAEAEAMRIREEAK